MTDANQSCPELLAVSRWAQAVLSAVTSASDPKSLQDWARHANAAPSTLRNRCAAVRLSPKASLDFARLLRALLQGQRLGYPLEILLDGDPRTVQKLLTAGGLSRSQDARSVDSFLAHQTLVCDPLIVEILRSALGEKGLA